MTAEPTSATTSKSMFRNAVDKGCTAYDTSAETSTETTSTPARTNLSIVRSIMDLPRISMHGSGSAKRDSSALPCGAAELKDLNSAPTTTMAPSPTDRVLSCFPVTSLFLPSYLFIVIHQRLGHGLIRGGAAQNPSFRKQQVTHLHLRFV